MCIYRESQQLVSSLLSRKCCAVQYFGFLSMVLWMALLWCRIQTIFIPETDCWGGIHHLLNIKSAGFLKSNTVSADLNILMWPRGKEKQRQDEKTIIFGILLNINDFSSFQTVEGKKWDSRTFTWVRNDPGEKNPIHYKNTVKLLELNYLLEEMGKMPQQFIF